MWRAFRRAALFGMPLLLAVGNAVALEPKDKGDETAVVAPQGRPDATEPDTMTAWKLQVVGLLERSKGYPPAAWARGEDRRSSRSLSTARVALPISPSRAAQASRRSTTMPFRW